MRINFLLPVLFLLSGAGHAGAQTLDGQVAKRFDAGIVMEVYQATRFAGLSGQQQLVFGAALKRRDSTLEGLVVQGAPAAIVEGVRRRLEKELHGLPGLKAYYDSVAVLDAAVAARHELQTYQRKYKLTDECVKQLEPAIRDKHSHLAKIEAGYALSGGKRDSLESEVLRREDSLIQGALIRDGVLVSSSQFVAALHFRKLLHLSEGQVDSLVAAGMHATYMRDSALRKDPFGSALDIRQYEYYNLSTILSEKQYSDVLGIEFRPNALVQATHDWNDLEKRGLVNAEMHKENVVESFTDYYIRVKSSSCLYAYDLNKQGAYSRSVRETMPKELKLLLYARKANITSANVETLNNQ